MKINIKSEDGTASNASITTDDGAPINGVERIRLDVRGGEAMRAELTFWMPKVNFRGVLAFVTEEHLRELADALGFDLKKRDG